MRSAKAAAEAINVNTLNTYVANKLTTALTNAENEEVNNQHTINKIENVFCRIDVIEVYKKQGKFKVYHIKNAITERPRI